MRAALLVLLVVLAGCSGAPVSESSSSGSATSSGPVGAVGNATNLGAAPPEWKVGQSWTWRIEGPPGMTPLEATTAVVSADASNYQIGSPDTAAAALLFPFHLVALGAVDKTNLAWDAHGKPVQLLRFPMKDGDTWTADFWNLPGAEVVVRSTNSDFTVRVSYPGTPDTLFLDAVWSPQKAQFTRVSSYFGAPTAFATATLVDEGTAPDAKPFVATELVRVTANPANPANAAPRSFTVPADANLVLLACFLGGGQGHFQATMVLADQQQTACQVTSAGGPVEYHAATRSASAGAGNLAVAPAGAGGVTVEVFAIKTA